jgi:predicted TIM-barrel fold metal-dependent hydrolase
LTALQCHRQPAVRLPFNGDRPHPGVHQHTFAIDVHHEPGDRELKPTVGSCHGGMSLTFGPAEEVGRKVGGAIPHPLDVDVADLHTNPRRLACADYSDYNRKMATATEERLISADDHVEMTHDRVKSHLDSRFHDDYDAGVGAFYESMARMRSSEANQQWREQANQPQDTTGGTMALADRKHPAAGRPGHSDPAARLRDMDTDGVAVSSSYCEVSAFRYLYLIKNGWQDATRAFNTALAEWASADPARLVVSYQIPIHDIDAAVAEVKWAAASGCKSLQLPVFPSELGLPDYWDARYDPLWTVISDSGLPICLHIGLNTGLDDLARRDPTPQRGIFVPMVPLSTAEQLGM